MKVSDKDVVNIIRAYQTELKPMKDIAKQYGMTREGIWKVLKRSGIDTSKATNGLIECSCTVCGKPVKKHRSYFKKTKHSFCGKECYFAWLGHGNGNPLIMHRQSSRIARHVVSQHFNLWPGHIVHHEDRNQYNNQLHNLKVFANNGDHVRHHRGFEVPILWDGSIK